MAWAVILEALKFWKWYETSKKRISKDCLNDLLFTGRGDIEKFQHETSQRRLSSCDKITAIILNGVIKAMTYSVVVLIMMTYNMGILIFYPLVAAFANLIFGLV